MKIFLTNFRSCAFCVLIASYFLLWLAGLPFVWHSEMRRYQWRCWAFRHWARSLLVALGIKLTVRGIAPVTPVFLVANHLSYLDIVILAAQVDCVFVAKSEVANWPVLGFLCRCMDTIFIDRNRRRDILRVNQLMEKALRAGKSVMFFPEGTTTDGVGILPFKSGLLEPATKTQTPVAYASMHYQTLPHELSAALSVCWWGDMNFLPHLLGLFGLSQVNATLQFGAATKQSAQRKLLAKELQIAVQEIFIPVRPSSETTQELIFVASQ